MDLLQLLTRTVEMKASDLHITVAVPPVVRINGSLTILDGYPTLGQAETEELVRQLTNEKQKQDLDVKGELDLSYSNPGLGRFRVNIYKQRGSYGIALRVVSVQTPTMESLGLPNVVKELAMKKRGLILVTGPTGSGKSTTLASMINYINCEKSSHIITLEDPIEYLHKHNKSIVNQREIGNDSINFSNALRSALRQDPDVLLIGEMRDLETISTAITAAETGHLVMSTLHTLGAVKTIDRIIDVFPPHQQQQVRVQLSTVLEGVISQQLLPKADKSGRVAAFEIMLTNTAARNLIREGKTHQIQSIIQTGSKLGMCTMDNSLVSLYQRGLVSRESALNYSIEKEMTERMLNNPI